MLIFVACYQFSFPFTLTPKLQICCLHGPIYPRCYSWGQLRTGSSQGDVLWEQPGSEWRIHPSREPKRCGLLVGGRCSLATGFFWGLFNEPPSSSSPPPWPVKISQNKTWSAGGGFADRGMKEKEKMRSYSGASLSVCPPPPPPTVHSVSATQPIVFPARRQCLFLKLSFCEDGRNPDSSWIRFNIQCSAETAALCNSLWVLNLLIAP